jgi:hypothetical protein
MSASENEAARGQSRVHHFDGHVIGVLCAPVVAGRGLVAELPAAEGQAQHRTSLNLLSPINFGTSIFKVKLTGARSIVTTGASYKRSMFSS